MPRLVRYVIIPASFSLLIVLAAAAIAAFAWENFVRDVSLLAPEWLRGRTPIQIQQAMSGLINSVYTLIIASALSGGIASLAWSLDGLRLEPSKKMRGAADLKWAWMRWIGLGLFILAVVNIFAFVLDPTSNVTAIVRPSQLIAHGAVAFFSVVIMYWLCTVLTTPSILKPAVPLSGWRPW